MSHTYNTIWLALSTERDYRLRFGNVTARVTEYSVLDPILSWRATEKRLHKFVVRLGTDKHIGVAVIEQDLKQHVCFLILGLLPVYRGKKLGSVTARLLLRKCFEDLRARRVESSALSSNLPSMNMQDSMKLEGRLEAKYIFDGQVLDELIFAKMRGDWKREHEVEGWK